MGIFLGASEVARIYLDTTQVKKVYLGTDLVYQIAGGDVLFDNGWIGGVEWAGNMLPRPNYTAIASYSFGNVDSDGYMKLTVASESGYSDIPYNCHVCTAQPVTVPAGATKMCVSVRQNLSGNPNMYLKFGLLTADCVNSMDDTNGGQLSEITLTSGTTLTTYELALNSGIAGGEFYAVVNARRTGKAAASRSLEIYKVYFE